jgi:Mannosyltransferase (PIG-V)
MVLVCMASCAEASSCGPGSVRRVRVGRRRLDPALAPFAWSRAAIWAAAVIFAAAFSPDRPRVHGPTPGGSGYWYRLWANWDGALYAQLAHHGYGTFSGTGAFYPLYPTLVGVLGRIFLGQYVTAGIVVALAAAAVSFVLLRRLTALELGDDVARRATIALAVFPLSFFLQAVYSESLFLALSLAAFYFARRERWAPAAGALALAFLTRPTAFAVWLGVLVLAWRSPLRRRALEWTLPTPVAFGLFPLILQWRVHDALAFIHDEKYWHRKLSPYGPFGGIVDGARAAAHGVHALVTTTATPPDFPYPANLSPKAVAAVNVEAFLWLLLFVALIVVVWRVLGAAYGLFAALSIALPLSEPWRIFPLYSLPRFGLVVFPFFIALALSRRLSGLLVVAAILYLAFDVWRWALWYWVA